MTKSSNSGQFLGIMDKRLGSYHQLNQLSLLYVGVFCFCFLFVSCLFFLFSLMVCVRTSLVCWLRVLVQRLMFYSFQWKMTGGGGGGAGVKARGQQNLFPSFYDLQHIRWLQLITGSMVSSSFWVDCRIHQFPGDEVSKLLPGPKVTAQN